MSNANDPDNEHLFILFIEFNNPHKTVSKNNENAR